MKRKLVDGQFGLFKPETDWQPPTSLPDLRGETIAIDSETRDDGLNKNRGPGWVYGWGWVSGISVAWKDEAIYVPLRHPDTENMDESTVVNWLENLFRNNRIVMHNAPYDMGWFWHMGVRVWPEKLDDTQAMAVMIDENRFSYSLDNLARWQGVPGKDEELLRQAAEAFGVDPKGGMWKLPGRYVAPYAIQDARATLGVFRKLVPLLDREGSGNAYRTETKLYKVVHFMRLRGIRINEDMVERTATEALAARDKALAEISSTTLMKVDPTWIWSAEKLGQLFDAEGVPYPRTNSTKTKPHGSPSFQAQWLEKHDHWLPKLIREARKCENLGNKFLRTYIGEYTHMGRVHAEVNQLRDEDGGTRTFRISYSDPPLQQMPSPDKDPFWAAKVRNCFEPEEDELWGAPDYSQQEPRFAVHLAAACNIRGADEAVHYLKTAPKPDFHTMVADLTGIIRALAKIINLGLMYGMGLEKLAGALKLTTEEAQEIIDQYHRNMPWLKGIVEHTSRLAGERGWIRLIDGARCHFDMWQPRRGKGNGALPFEKAKEMWPDDHLVRAFTHKAFNSACQGNGARQTKMAMLACYEEGYLPLIQMHDEIGFSFPRGEAGRIAGDRCAEIMRNVVQLRVPVKVDAEYGPTWGTAKKSWDEAMSYMMEAA